MVLVRDFWIRYALKFLIKFLMTALSDPFPSCPAILLDAGVILSSRNEALASRRVRGHLDSSKGTDSITEIGTVHMQWHTLRERLWIANRLGRLHLLV